MTAAFLASASWQLLLAGGGAALGRVATGHRAHLITGWCRLGRDRRCWPSIRCSGDSDPAARRTRRRRGRCRDAPRRAGARRTGRTPTPTGWPSGSPTPTAGWPRGPGSSPTGRRGCSPRPTASWSASRSPAATATRTPRPRPSCTRSTPAPSWWGTGLAQRLWDAVRPEEPCSLWVLEDNLRAQAFYRRQGFVARRRPRVLRRPRHLGDQDDQAMTYFDLSDPTFDVTSPTVHDARDESWYVETNWGWAVLRYAEVERAAARPAVPAGQRPLAGAERHPLRAVLGLVAGDPAQPRGRRPRADPAAADAGVPQQDDRGDAAALPGARRTS